MCHVLSHVSVFIAVQCDPWTSSFGINWQLIRNAVSQPRPTELVWTLPRSFKDLYALYSWRITKWPILNFLVFEFSVQWLWPELFSRFSAFFGNSCLYSKCAIVRHSNRYNIKWPIIIFSTIGGLIFTGLVASLLQKVGDGWYPLCRVACSYKRLLHEYYYWSLVSLVWVMDYPSFGGMLLLHLIPDKNLFGRMSFSHFKEGEFLF